MAGDSYNHPTWRDMENHPVWDIDPKYEVLKALVRVPGAAGPAHSVRHEQLHHPQHVREDRHQRGEPEGRDALGGDGDPARAYRFLSRTSSSGADHGYGLISISAGSSTRGPMP